MADPGEELDAVAAALSHDLRAPLRAIDGFSRILLADDEALPEATRRYLALVRDAGTEVAALLEDLVEVIRVGRAEPVVVDGVDVARLARELVATGLGGGSAVAWEIGEVPPCRADPVLLRRLLEELMGNAVRFGGRRVAVGFADGAYRVADDGIGVDGALPEQAYGIFTRLQGRDEVGGDGTGAGLAIARRIAEAHGGRLWVTGRPGAGTTAWFTVGGPG